MRFGTDANQVALVQWQFCQPGALPLGLPTTFHSRRRDIDYIWPELGEVQFAHALNTPLPGISPVPGTHAPCGDPEVWLNGWPGRVPPDFPRNVFGLSLCCDGPMGAARWGLAGEIEPCAGTDVVLRDQRLPLLSRERLTPPRRWPPRTPAYPPPPAPSPPVAPVPLRDQRLAELLRDHPTRPDLFPARPAALPPSGPPPGPPAFVPPRLQPVVSPRGRGRGFEPIPPRAPAIVPVIVPQVLQVVQENAAGVNSATIVFGANTTFGNELILCIFVRQGFGTNVLTGTPHGWTLVSTVAGTQFNTYWLTRTANGGTESTTYTCTQAVGPFPATMWEVSDLAGTIDQTATNGYVISAPTSETVGPTGTLSRANEMAFAMGCAVGLPGDQFLTFDPTYVNDSGPDFLSAHAVQPSTAGAQYTATAAATGQLSVATFY
jgi:hypothetical protein